MKTSAAARPARPRITDFDDYRVYLSSLFAFCKRTQRGFSHTSIARKIGVSRSYLKHVFDGRRNIGLDRIDPVAKAFRLSRAESDYFTFWVVKALTTEVNTQSHLDAILLKLHHQLRWELEKTYESPSVEQNSVLGNWLQAAIYELVKFADFEPTALWLQRSLIDHDRISTDELDALLQRLISRGLLKNEGGKWNVPDLRVLAEPFSSDSFEVYRSIVAKTFSILGEPARYRGCNFFQSVLAVDKESEIAMVEAFQTCSRGARGRSKQARSSHRHLE